MSARFDLLIIFWDGTRKIVKDVDGYGTYDAAELFYYEKNGFRSYMPIDKVTFIGRLSDWED